MYPKVQQKQKSDIHRKKCVLTCKLGQAHIASYFYRMQCSGAHVEPSQKRDMKPLLLSYSKENNAISVFS